MIEKFLAHTKKYGWIVVTPAPQGWTGFFTVPGKYSIDEKDVLDRAALPPLPNFAQPPK